MERRQQVDLAAYYALQHSAHDARLRLSAPMTMTDAVSALLLNRGKRPSGASAASRATPVTVYGGEATEGLVRAAEAWGDANRARHWASRTESTPEAIQWALAKD